jgi:hypothetical protein
MGARAEARAKRKRAVKPKRTAVAIRRNMILGG